MKTQLLCRPLTSTAFFKSVFSSDNLLASFISCNKLPNFIACLATRSPDSRHATTKFGDFVAKVDLVLLCQVKSFVWVEKKKKTSVPEGWATSRTPFWVSRLRKNAVSALWNWYWRERYAGAFMVVERKKKRSCYSLFRCSILIKED